MTIGNIDLDFKWAISLRKSIPPSKLFSRNWFSKAPQASSMLILSRQSEVCPAFFFCQEQGERRFQFKSNHMKGKNLWKNQPTKAMMNCLYSSTRRWLRMSSAYLPPSVMRWCTRESSPFSESAADWSCRRRNFWNGLRRILREEPLELPSLPPTRPYQKLLSSAEWNLFSGIILRWDRRLCLSDVLWKSANLPVLSELQHHWSGNWNEQEHGCQVR